MKIAFLGIGAMGKGIASNLLKAQFPLSIWNLKDSCWDNVLELGNQGAAVCESIEDAAADADFIGLSLTNDKIVEIVCRQILPFVKKGCIIWDCSTTSPDCSKQMEQLFSQHDISYLDTPVSGGAQGAAEGTLTIMAGGDKAAYEKLIPLLDAVSALHLYMGPSGSGQTAKLINQMLTAINQGAVCEAFAVARKTQLDLNQLNHLLLHSWGSSRMLERSAASYIIPDTYDSAACIALLLKDLNLCQALASSLSCNVPYTDLTQNFFRLANEHGWGNQDHSKIIKLME